MRRAERRESSPHERAAGSGGPALQIFTRPLLAVAIAGALLAGPGPAIAQDEEIGIEITGDPGSRLALAVPPTVAGGGARLTDAAEIGRTLRDDLEFSGWFGLLDARGEGRIPSARLDEPSAWQAVGASYLA
ncbi:MAG: hypothetical protein OEQ13_14790, partial [Acidobacteriota bacterium]|nr:hypothetical protein [Acidobacteriota bacterium]